MTQEDKTNQETKTENVNEVINRESINKEEINEIICATCRAEFKLTEVDIQLLLLSKKYQKSIADFLTHLTMFKTPKDTDNDVCKSRGKHYFEFSEKLDILINQYLLKYQSANKEVQTKGKEIDDIVKQIEEKQNQLKDMRDNLVKFNEQEITPLVESFRKIIYIHPDEWK